jgi:hypothetical protein
VACLKASGKKRQSAKQAVTEDVEAAKKARFYNCPLICRYATQGVVAQRGFSSLFSVARVRNGQEEIYR